MGDKVIVERDVPVGSSSPVGVVLALSLGSGLVVFVGAGLLALAFGWKVAVAAGASGGAILGVWLWWVVRIYDLFWASEKVTTDAPVKQPPKPVVSVEVAQPDRGRWQYLDLPGGPEELTALARGLLAGRTFAQAEWTGSGRPYSRSEFRELRGQLLERGLLSWRNERAPSQGVELTAVGRSVFRHIAENAGKHTYADGGSSFALLDGLE